MITLSLSPTGINRSGYASDRNELERGGSLGAPSPVRHQRRSTSDGFGVLGSTGWAPALDDDGARTRCSPRAWHGVRQPGNCAAHAQKNNPKPWRRVMWCIGALTQEYRDRMYALLELYARPMSKAEPVICIDEKSLQ